MDQPDVRLERVTKAFGEVKAVDDLSLSFERGGFVALLGPSGCGKTTTLRMIGGFEEPTSGTVYLGEQNVTGLPPYKREVNTVFQNYALFPHMSIQDNVAFGLRERKVPKAEIAKRVPEMLELVELKGFEKRKPTQLSGGQAQRVALARALINHPRVLLLDEPLGALDLKLRKQMQLELKRIQTEVNITFIHVTHDQEEAMTMADRIAVMNQGRIEQIGPPAELYERPEDGLRRRLPGRQQPAQREGLRQRRGDAARRHRRPGRDGHAERRPAGRADRRQAREGAARGGGRDRPRPTGRTSSPARFGTSATLASAAQYIVDTTAGDEIVVFAQNAGRTIDQLRNGDGVRILWEPEHTFVITDSGEVPSVEELV